MKIRQLVVPLAAALVTPAVLAAVTVPPAQAPFEDQESQFEAVQARTEASQQADQDKAKKPAKRDATCKDGFAEGTDFACDRVDLLAQVTLAEMGLTFGNDIWGWTSKKGNREWAIAGGLEGTAFVEVTDPKRPVVTGFLPASSTERFRSWRDIKVVNDHAFIVSEAIGHGMQVFDLTRLLDAAPGTTFTEDGRYVGNSRAHNIVAAEDAELVVLVGADVCAGGLHIVDVSAPTAPTFAGCFDAHGYVHDSQCVTYTGPDAEHRGATICVSSVSNRISSSLRQLAVSVVDITDPMAPAALSLTEYSNGRGYSHQGWLTEDQATFLHGDELDEYYGTVPTTTTRMFDVSDLDAPSEIGSATNGRTSIDHNLFIRKDTMYAGNYTTGLRVFDAKHAADGVLPEVGFFDTYPLNDATTFEGGVWGTYPFFKNGKTVAVQTMDAGLFLLRPKD